MVHIVNGMFCFVTVVVSILYGTRVCWICGKECNFSVDPVERKRILKQKIPAGFAIYVFGFFVLFSFVFNGFLIITVTSLVSSLILSHFVVSMAMPVFKRNPSV